MTDLVASFSHEDYETVTVHDMGDGCLVVDQSNERGETGRIVLDWQTHRSIVEAFAARYDATKNTDRPLAVLEI